MTRALAGKVTIPLTPVALGSRVDFSRLTNRSLFGCEGLCSRRTCWFDARGTGGRFTWGRKCSVEAWLASSGGSRVILKVTSVKIGSSRLI